MPNCNKQHALAAKGSMRLPSKDEMARIILLLYHQEENGGDGTQELAAAEIINLLAMVSDNVPKSIFFQAPGDQMRL